MTNELLKKQREGFDNISGILDNQSDRDAEVYYRFKDFLSQCQQEILEAKDREMREKITKGEISDGYHTFNELYEHRHTLYIALCKTYRSKAWRATKHSDGSSYDGWFILGMGKEKGEQITYHLPISKWGDCDNWCETLSKAPEWDGHTPQDVLDRIKLLK